MVCAHRPGERAGRTCACQSKAQGAATNTSKQRAKQAASLAAGVLPACCRACVCVCACVRCVSTARRSPSSPAPGSFLLPPHLCTTVRAVTSKAISPYRRYSNIANCDANCHSFVPGKTAFPYTVKYFSYSCCCMFHCTKVACKRSCKGKVGTDEKNGAMSQSGRAALTQRTHAQTQTRTHTHNNTPAERRLPTSLPLLCSLFGHVCWRRPALCSDTRRCKHARQGNVRTPSTTLLYRALT